MPVARDFFDTFELLPVSRNPWVLREGLTGYLHSEKGIPFDDSISYLTSGIDIEDLHSEIEAGLIDLIDSGGDPLSTFHYRAFNELVFIFALTANAIQNGPISSNHLRIAKLLTDDDAIITFNWDTLMDRALAVETDWQPDWGYNFTARQVFRNSWQDPSLSKSNAGSPKLLKLHGSTNWITSYVRFDRQSAQLKLMQSSPPETVYVYEVSDDPYNTYAGRYMPGYGPYSYGYYPPNILDDAGASLPEGHVVVSARQRVPWKKEGTSGNSGLVSMPLIIPPVRKKSYDRFGPLFDGLWQSAEESLAAAEHIVVIGYSFPETDYQSIDLFLRSFSNRTSLPRVTIVDPNPRQIRDRFVFQFGIPEDELECHGVYFDDDFPVENVL
jgi:hypothetical protein